MFTRSKLGSRNREDEIMDDPGLAADRHFAALDGLARLNSWSGSSRLLWSPIEALARETTLRQLRVLDIATGSGDVPLALWRRARRAGVELEIVGADVSERALQHARQRAAACQAPLEFQQLDALHEPLPTDFDVIVCSLFLHHLDDGQASRLLAAMGQAAGSLVVVSDLLRTRRGLWLTEVAVRLLTRSDVVRVDGPRSVRAAFSFDEARRLADSAGLHGAELRRRWPNRFVLAWRKGGQA